MELLPLIATYIGIFHLLRKSLDTARRLPWWDQILSKVWLGSLVYFALAQIPFLGILQHWYGEIVYALLLATVFLLRDYSSARLFGVALLPFAAIFVLNSILRLMAPSFMEAYHSYFEPAEAFSKLWLIGFGAYAVVVSNKQLKIQRKEEERIQAAEARRAELEHLVKERTTELMQQKTALEQTLAELKAAQNQLIHAEKMASLGELTAGIAHEIQNPLNFVNNFAELSVELAQELQDEMARPDPDKALIRELLHDLAQNQEKINHHGKRAANIVSGMLQHARTSTGKKEPVDLNALADEYLRLSYHGLRAKDKRFNAKMLAELDPAIGLVDVIPQDFGRVLLNLINNAFYAVTEKKNRTTENYDPTVTVSTRLLTAPSGAGEQVEILIRDNGTGIPEHVKAKIFQPFFTTKPTGQGTGLGLSLAYDIVTKGHGGTMEMESTEGEGTTFIIQIPKT